MKLFYSVITSSTESGASSGSDLQRLKGLTLFIRHPITIGFIETTYFISIVIFFLFIFSINVEAQTPVSGTSAGLKKAVEVKKDNYRILRLKSFLKKYNSELTSEAQFVIDRADEYEIPWTLVAAISGVESGFCKAIPYNSYNCWGWNNGATKFTDYRHAIETVSKTIKKSYYDRGLDTPYKMNSVYAPPSATWGWKVQYFMDLIENHRVPTYQN